MWCVLQVPEGEEMTIKHKLNEFGFIALVPREMKKYRKGGNWHTKENVIFSCYVFCDIDYIADTYYKIKKISPHIKFLGGKEPSKMTQMEIEWIKILSNNDTVIEPIVVEIDSDGTVNIKNNLLKIFNNNIIQINKRQKKATFEITICNEVKKFTFSIDLIDNEQM